MVAQWVKNLALSLLWLWLLLPGEFSPWAGNLYMLGCSENKKKEGLNIHKICMIRC